MRWLKIIGLEFICKVYDVQYKEIAERIGVSNQTITDWIKGKTSKIPEKRLNEIIENFPEFAGINKEIFSKRLTPMDKQKITTAYLISDIQRQLEESIKKRDLELIQKGLEMANSAQDGLISSINLDSLILISEHLIDNREFMQELDKLIIKYKPALKEHLK